MNKKVKKILTEAGIFTALFAISGGATYAFCFANQGSAEKENVIDTPLTPQEKLLNSMTSLSSFDLDASLEVVMKTNERANLKVVGQGSLGNSYDISLDTTFRADYNGTAINGDLSFYDSKIYMDFNNSHFRLKTNSLIEFIDMLPGYGANVDLPDEIANIDFATIEQDLLKMEQITTPDGGYYFVFTLDGENGIDLYFKADASCNFTGIRTDKFFYKDAYIYLNVDINKTDSGLIANPEEGEYQGLYQDFEPAFQLFDGLYNVFSSKQNTININVDVKKNNEAFIGFDGDLSYDLETSQYFIDAGVSEHGRTHNFDLGLKDSKMFVNYNDIIKISIQNQNASSLVEYVISKLDDATIDDVFNQVSELMNNPDLSGVMDNLSSINALILSVDVTASSVLINIDPSAFNIEADAFVIESNFSEDELLSISLKNVEVSGYLANITLTPKTYNAIAITDSEYEELDKALTLIDTFETLAKETQFRLTFDGLVDNSDEAISDITIDGGLQFDIKNHFGYGNVDIVDRSAYSHKLYVDMKSPEELLFAYNTKMRGKFSSQTLADVFELAKGIYEEKDEHFMELFGDLLTSVAETPLMEAINNKDYGAILTYDILSNLKITSTEISFQISGALVGLDCTLDMKINYDYEHIYSLEVKNLVLNDNTYSFTLGLENFNTSLESGRLDPSLTYLDFSDIKVLLEFGINTSEFNSWHLTGAFNLNILNIIDKSINIDLKIKNDHGNVSIAADIGEIPSIALVTANENYYGTRTRYAHLYYEDGLFYVYRTEVVKTKVIDLFGTSWKNYSVVGVLETDYFLDNILDVFCSKLLGLQSRVTNLIQSSSTESSQGTIHYEEVLNDFVYNKNENYFYFDINIAELAQNEDLKTMTLKVYADSETNELTSISLYLGINVGISIKINLDLSLVNRGETVDISAMTNFVTAHKDDEKNVYVTKLG